MSNAECLVLGLIKEGYRYGHELDRVVEQRDIRRWVKISRVAIYQVLDRLTQRGWVEAGVERAGRMPERTVYTLTPDGEAALRQMVREGLASDEPVRFEYSVALSQLGVLPPEEALAQLEKRRETIRAYRRHLEADTRHGARHLPIGPRALMRHSRAFYRLEESWLTWLIRQLQQGSEPPRTDSDRPDGSAPAR